ncbi:hypothetical protein [Streptomyces sp. NPDC017993]|uniref:hypothetical protein n=1 Tax=Streptomyces sp. NPDC017993 TaxID=3365027 RepID=UPI0037AFACD9
MHPSGALTRTVATVRRRGAAYPARSGGRRGIRGAGPARGVLTAGLSAALLVGAAATLGAAPAAAHTSTPAAREAAAHGPVPSVSCGRPDSARFPIDARVAGGPRAYPAGGDWQNWKLELRNNTDAACEDVHPVVVLVAAHRGLRSGSIHLEFRDPAGGGWRPVPFESTERDEQIGVFGKGADDGAGGSPAERAAGRGVTVPAKGTTTLPVRMRFAPETPQSDLTAKVTTMQRRGSDGEWVGQSDDYRFAVRPRDTSRPRSPGTPTAPSASAAPGLPVPPGAPVPPVSPVPPMAPVSPVSPVSPMSPGLPVPPRAPASPDATPAPHEPTPPSELATTGHAPVFGFGALGAGMLLSGGVLLAWARRLRR